MDGCEVKLTALTARTPNRQVNAPQTECSPEVGKSREFGALALSRAPRHGAKDPVGVSYRNEGGLLVGMGRQEVVKCTSRERVCIQGLR